jgi:hypothetical protein
MKLSRKMLAVTQIGVPFLMVATSQSQVTLERGAHHQVVEVSHQNESGSVTQAHYTALGNGWHYRDAAGTWVESKPVIQDYGDTILCTGASFRVMLTTNLNTTGAVDLETSDRQRIVSHPLGIAFYDPESGNSVLLAQIQDSRAELVSSNLIVYRDAFVGNGLRASVTYGYWRGRFHQDVTFERAPAVTPADFGMGPSTRLEVLTEFVDSPTPTLTPVVMKREKDEAKRTRMVAPDLVDEKLDYGAMAMYLGRAFTTEAGKRGGVPVAKRLVKIEDRTVLTEAVEWRDVEANLAKLPRQAAAGSRPKPFEVGQRELPRRMVAERTERPSFEARLARVTRAGPPRLAMLPQRGTGPEGFVLDYELIESASEFTFESGQTYYVVDYVLIDGVATFEAGAVIKYAPGAQLTIAGTVNGPDGTVVFTAKDDDSVGQSITNSTGLPSGSYADIALAFYYISYSAIGYLDIRFADTGLYCYTGSWSVSSSSFLNCDLGVYASSSSIYLSGVDLCNVATWYDHNYEGSISPNALTECATSRDGDNMADNWELAYFGHLGRTGSGDYDTDGMSDYNEYLRGRNPTVSGTTADSSGAIKLSVFTPLK